MPIIPKQSRQPKTTLSIRIDQPVKDLLDEYCLFAESGREHVVTCAVKRLFEEDVEFRQWRERRGIQLATGQSA